MDGQTDAHTKILIDRQTNRQIETKKGRQTDRHTQTDRWMDRWTDRQTDRRTHTHRLQKDRQIHQDNDIHT